MIFIANGKLVGESKYCITPTGSSAYWFDRATKQCYQTKVNPVCVKDSW